MRYEDVTSDVYDILEKMLEYFPETKDARYKILYDTKKKKSGDRYVIGRIKKANDEIKAMVSIDNAGTPPDYIMFLDKQVFLNLSDRDKERIIYHELCHTKYNPRSENPYGIQDHEIQTFYDEIEFNSDDNRWNERVAAIAASVHDPENNPME